jgi:hypothetical protein
MDSTKHGQFHGYEMARFRNSHKQRRFKKLDNAELKGPTKYNAD